MTSNEAVRADRRLSVRPASEVRRGHLPLGDPEGAADRIEVTSGWIERGGVPTFPITGEVHYSRLPRERWDEVLGHARAGGLTSVATYVLWQAHEPSPGDFRWDGNLDLRAFVKAAARHGLDVIVRMGPWAHGEARHGGFPDWLLALDVNPRTNDPAYLDLVRPLYAQIVAQLAGLSHAEGGPVIGAQMDNELYDQPEHLATLRRIAEEAGLDVPLWTATGWGGAEVPATLMPVYSAYADGFWEDTATDWPAFSAFHFRYSEVRDDLTVGADLREALDGIVLAPGRVALKDDSAVPFATCELGGGMHVAYHRRPLVTPRDVAALALAKIGSGSVWQGYYMYAGGTQRTGAAGTEHESHATGYPNDVPTLTYDFHAPIGEHGQIRDHHHLLRRQHLWLATDPAIAAMRATVGGGEDGDDLRWAVRADDARGYLFATTYQPDRAPLPAQPGVRFQVALEDGTVTVPRRPVDLPAGVSVAWPLRFPLAGGLALRSATAGIVTRVPLEDGRDLLVLAATDGVPVEIVLEGDVDVAGPVDVELDGGSTAATLTRAPGPETVVDVPGTRILVADPATADRLYVLDIEGAARPVLSECPVYALDGDLVLHSERPAAALAVLAPPGDGALWAHRTVATGGGVVPLGAPGAVVAPAPPRIVRGGPLDRLSAPTDFSGAARVPVAIPREALDGVDRVLLRVGWTGDVGRAVVNGRVIGDHFWHGRDWDIDLTPVRDEVAAGGLVLELLPWRAATGVWVDPSVRAVPDGITVRSLDVIRVARTRLTAGDRP
ncbi:beta-galactosidase [Demequina soli]|uniref:beta-galactosidase n=1 Tax=Demequina soli TaxID=1638987 RepID=UPI000780F9EE|nr:beta-galactosidase [Demequina soli]